MSKIDYIWNLLRAVSGKGVCELRGRYVSSFRFLNSRPQFLMYCYGTRKWTPLSRPFFWKLKIKM